MHIYHYAAYECSAVRRLSTRHDTRQDEVDELLRNDVFVDLYQIVRRSLRIGEDSYSIKSIETLYRFKRVNDIVTASGSIVQYANWMASGEPQDSATSPILKAIRDYNEDDCRSNAELTEWLRNLAKRRGIAFAPRMLDADTDTEESKSADPEIAKRQELAAKLRSQGDAVSIVLGDLVDYHRREAKPMWWRHNQERWKGYPYGPNHRISRWQIPRGQHERSRREGPGLHKQGGIRQAVTEQNPR